MPRAPEVAYHRLVEDMFVYVNGMLMAQEGALEVVSSLPIGEHDLVAVTWREAEPDAITLLGDLARE